MVSLGDGTWVQLDELPIVAWVPIDQIDRIDEFPVDCQAFDHIHIRALVEESHWDDHKPVLPDLLGLPNQPPDIPTIII